MTFVLQPLFKPEQLANGQLALSEGNAEGGEGGES